MIKRIYIFLLLFFFSTNALALSEGFDTLFFRPSPFADAYFTTLSTQNSDANTFTFSTTFDYAYRPMQLTGANKNRFNGIIDHAFVQHFTASANLVDNRLSLGVSWPVAWVLDYRFPTFNSSNFKTVTASGDPRVSLKWTLKDHNQWGIAIIPYIGIPLDSGRYFVGANSFTGGTTVAFDYTPFDFIRMSLNAGLEFHNQWNVGDQQKGKNINLSLGTQVKISKNFSVISEIQSQTRLTGPFKEELESPLEARIGFKTNIKNTPFSIHAGSGMGIIKGSSAPQYRGFLGLTYKP